MKGAIVFLVFFVAMTVFTLLYADLPPGRQIYGMLDVPETGYPVGGIPATVLILSLFNGIVYGIIAWLIYSIAIAAKPRSYSRRAPVLRQPDLIEKMPVTTMPEEIPEVS